MGTCLRCKYCVKLTCGYGCKKDKKIIADPTAQKDCVTIDLYKMLGIERKVKL